jgi:NTE family protein
MPSSMTGKLKQILLFVFLFAGGVLFSQKTALVLSGGGAKGLAHIGVLQALEEHDIPIDYVVGNSMGALIGGLYAAGYSPEQMKALLGNPDTYQFLRGNTKKDYFFFQKYEEDASWVTIPFAIDEGLHARIPFNVYNIQDLDYMIMEYFAKAAAASGYNFDSLMVPFRCVATDIDSSKIVVLSEGDLAKAVRASLTFPFFVRPIKVDEKLLFDGGMMDNFPVNVAQEAFHPEFIIGSKAVQNYDAPKADDVFSQLQNMLMKKADFTVDSADGIVVEIASGNENVFQFQKVESYIDSGYVAALRTIPELKKRLRKKQAKADIETKRRAFFGKQPQLIIGDVIIDGVNKKQEHYFKKSIRFREGEVVDSKTFKKQYDRLLANENVRTAYPSLCFNDSTRKFDITLNIKPADPFNIRFGGYISSSAVNQGYIYLGYQHLGRTSKQLNVSTYFGTFYNSFSAIGKYEQQGKVPFYLMVDFLISRRNYFTNATYFYEDPAPAFIVIDENYLDINAGLPVGLSHVVRLGISSLNFRTLYYQDNYFTRTDTADRSNFYFVNPYLEFERSKLDRKQFPSKGSYFYLGLNYYIGEEHTIPGSTTSGEMEFRKRLDFFLASLHYQQYFQLWKPVVIGVQADAAWSNKPLLSNYVSSLLIASPYEPVLLMRTIFLESFRAYSYGSIGAKAIFELYKRLDLRLEAYYYVPYQKILREEESNDAYFSKPFSYSYLAGTAQLVYHTGFGPIGFAVNYFEKPSDKVTFLFNIGYLIFNKSRFYK